MEKEQLEIIHAAMELFAQKGLKFTMQDIAENLHIAKKTIYQFYPSKEELMIGVMDYGFEEIHAKKKKILAEDMSTAEKIRKVMIAMPDQYAVFDFRLFSELQDKYPAAYKKLNEHLESDWEPVISLLEEGQKEGTIRPVSVPVLRLMITASFESFLSGEELKIYGISYQDALNNMMDIIMTGITQRRTSDGDH